MKAWNLDCDARRILIIPRYASIRNRITTRLGILFCLIATVQWSTLKHEIEDVIQQQKRKAIRYLLPLTELQIISLKAKVADRLSDGASKEFQYHGTYYQIGLWCCICLNHVISWSKSGVGRSFKREKHIKLKKIAQVSKPEKESMQSCIQEKKTNSHVFLLRQENTQDFCTFDQGQEFCPNSGNFEEIYSG